MLKIIIFLENNDIGHKLLETELVGLFSPPHGFRRGVKYMLTHTPGCQLSRIWRDAQGFQLLLTQ